MPKPSFLVGGVGIHFPAGREASPVRPDYRSGQPSTDGILQWGD
jgi:hypothetical protein